MSTTENVEKPSRPDEDALVLDTPVPAEEEPPAAKEKPPVESVKDAAERVQELRVMRALKRYGTARGNLLAGGIAYSGLFSVAAALTIAWTIFMSLMGSNLALRRNVLNGIDAALPGIIQFSPGDGGIIKPDDLVLNTAINLTSVIAFFVLLWSAIATMGGLANAIRSMFGIWVVKENPAILYLRNFAGFIILAIGVVASSLLTTAAGVLGNQILDLMNIAGTFGGYLLRAVTFAVSLGVDMLVIAFLVRVMASVRVIKKDLWIGCLIAGIGTSIIRVLGTSVVSSVSDNKLLASVAVVATLLLWLNLGARILLMACTFMANPPRPYQVTEAEELHFKETPNYITLSAVHTLEWNSNPVTGAVAPTNSPDEVEEVPEEQLPRWGGMLGNISRWRAERLERRAEKVNEQAEEAREKYNDGARRMVAVAEKNHKSGKGRKG